MANRVAVAALTVFLGVSLVQPGSGQTVDEVLEKHFEAMGGAESWADLQSMRASGTLSVAGGMAEGPFTLVQNRPAMWRMDVTIQGMSIVQAYDGDIAWQINPMMGSPEPQVADAMTAEIIIANSDLDGPLVGWKEDGHQIEVMGHESVDGTDTIKLQVTANGNISFYYLDASSYLPFQIESSTGGQSTKARLSDYREVGGLLFPFAIDIETGMGPQSLVFDSIEVNIDVDETEFSMGSS